MVEELYRTYKQDVYGYLLSLIPGSLLGGGFAIGDLLKGDSKPPKVPRGLHLKDLATGIARNVWLQELRRRRKTVEYSDL